MASIQGHFISLPRFTMVGVSCKKEIRQSRRLGDVKSASKARTISRISKRRKDSMNVDESSRNNRRSKKSNDDATLSSSGSEVSCRNYEKRRSHRNERRGWHNNQRRDDSPESSYRSSSTAPSNVMSIDTAENSESRLQDIGRVVKASDLTDYSDQYTLGSREMEEFEGYLHKHKSRGHRTFYASDSDGSSAIYSLDSRDDRPVAPSDDTSGVVAINSSDREHTNIVNCGYKACFCIDDKSIEESYGGLRDDQVLIAASCTLTSHGSAEFTDGEELSDGEEAQEASIRTLSRRVERMESQAESTTSDATDAEDQEDGDTVKTEEPSGVSRFFCSWGASPSDGGEDEDDDEYGLPEVVTTLTQQGNESIASHHTANVVWQRSGSYDSAEESLGEDRADAIAKKARAENILNKFKKAPPKAEPRLDIQDITPNINNHITELKGEINMSLFQDADKADDGQLQRDSSINEPTKQAIDERRPSDESAEHTAINIQGDTAEIIPQNTSINLQDDTAKIIPQDEITPQKGAVVDAIEEAPIEDIDLSLDFTYVLGDNVEVTGMTEVEAGNGDTGFLIFLRASRNSLTEDGEAAVRSFMERRRETSTLNGLCSVSDMTQSRHEAEGGLNVFIVIENDNQCSDKERPRLLIEEKASIYLANLSRLSEASYYCLDRKTKQEVTRVIQSHQCGTFLPVDLSVRSTFSQESPGNVPSFSQPSKDGVAQFIFCMRADDMICKVDDKSSAAIVESLPPVIDNEKNLATVEFTESASLLISKVDEPPLAENGKKAIHMEDEQGLVEDSPSSGSRPENSYPLAVIVESTTRQRIEDPDIPCLRKPSVDLTGDDGFAEKPSVDLTGHIGVATKPVVDLTGNDGVATKCTNEGEKQLSLKGSASVNESQIVESTFDEDKDIDILAEVGLEVDTPTKMRQTLAAAISKERSNPKYLRGMSRATVKAHALMQGGKIPRRSIRSTSPSKRTITTPETNIKSTDDIDQVHSELIVGKNGTLPKATSSGGGEDSSSSRGFSLHSCGRRSSGEESLKGTRFIHEEGKSSSGSFSNHSARIQDYLEFLDERDDEDTTGIDCLTSERSLEKLTDHAKNIGENAVSEAMDILNDLNLNLDYDDSYSSDGKDRDLPEPNTPVPSPPIPSNIPNVNVLLFGDINDSISKSDTLGSIKSDLSSDERQLKSYEDRWRLTQSLLLSDHPVRIENGPPRYGMVQFEKSQIDRMGLSRQRRNASVASSHGSTTSCDEFFDAVSRNSSSSSVD